MSNSRLDEQAFEEALGAWHLAYESHTPCDRDEHDHAVRKACRDFLRVYLREPLIDMPVNHVDFVDEREPTGRVLPHDEEVPF